MEPQTHVSQRDYNRTYHRLRKQTHKRVNVTMTQDEYALFQQIAADLDISEAQTILQLAKASLKVVPPPVPKATRDLIRESLVTIRRAGNVFNQCAKLWHRKSYIPERDRPLWVENLEFLAHHFQKFENAIMRLGSPEPPNDR